MGFNATVVVLCDQLSEIEKDRAFGAKLAEAIRIKSAGSKADLFLTGQTQVVSVHHAHGQMVLAVGGNTGRVIGYGGSYDCTDDVIVRNIAMAYGYVPRADAAREEDARKAVLDAAARFKDVYERSESSSAGHPDAGALRQARDTLFQALEALGSCGSAEGRQDQRPS
jgi:hypothetical protein